MENFQYLRNQIYQYIVFRSRLKNTYIVFSKWSIEIQGVWQNFEQTTVEIINKTIFIKFVLSDFKIFERKLIFFTDLPKNLNNIFMEFTPAKHYIEKKNTYEVCCGQHLIIKRKYVFIWSTFFFGEKSI